MVHLWYVQDSLPLSSRSSIFDIFIKLFIQYLKISSLFAILKIVFHKYKMIILNWYYQVYLWIALILNLPLTQYASKPIDILDCAWLLNEIWSIDLFSKRRINWFFLVIGLRRRKLFELISPISWSASMRIVFYTIQDIFHL